MYLLKTIIISAVLLVAMIFLVNDASKHLAWLLEHYKEEDE